MTDKIEISAEIVKEKLKQAQGNISFTANQFGVSRTWLHAYINEHPTVKAALADIRESTVDRAETMLQSRMAHSDTLLIFFLKTQARGRGYVERTEHGGIDGKPIETKSQVTHAIDGDTALTIFDILTAAGALPSASSDAETQ